MKKNKEVLTTGEAANYCSVSQQTIIRLCDNGTLKHHKVPGSKFRRILAKDLRGMMARTGLPTEKLDKDFPEYLPVATEEKPDGTFIAEGPDLAQVG